MSLTSNQKEEENVASKDFLSLHIRLVCKEWNNLFLRSIPLDLFNTSKGIMRRIIMLHPSFYLMNPMPEDIKNFNKLIKKLFNLPSLPEYKDLEKTEKYSDQDQCNIISERFNLLASKGASLSLNTNQGSIFTFCGENELLYNKFASIMKAFNNASDSSSRKNISKSDLEIVKAYVNSRIISEEALYYPILLQICTSPCDTDYQFVEELIKSGLKINAQDYYAVYCTALHALAQNEDSQVTLPLLKLLLKNGADAKIKNYNDKSPHELAKPRSTIKEALTIAYKEGNTTAISFIDKYLEDLKSSEKGASIGM